MHEFFWYYNVSPEVLCERRFWSEWNINQKLTCNCERDTKVSCSLNHSQMWNAIIGHQTRWSVKEKMKCNNYMVDSVPLIRYNLQIIIQVWVGWQLMSKTGKSQLNITFSRISRGLFLNIFSAVNSTLSLHVQKEELIMLFMKGRKSNKATIKEGERMHLKLTPHTMCASGRVKSLTLTLWANMWHS